MTRGRQSVHRKPLRAVLPVGWFRHVLRHVMTREHPAPAAVVTFPYRPQARLLDLRTAPHRDGTVVRQLGNPASGCCSERTTPGRILQDDLKSHVDILGDAR